MELSEWSEANKARHAPALAWMAQLTMAHALVWSDRAGVSDAEMARLAVQRLFQQDDFPAECLEEDLRLRRDPLGKPYIEWQGAVRTWAVERGRDSRHLHLSNTHDGGAHLALVAYDPRLVGLGVDAVYLPRLRTAGKNVAYLRRFASYFMGAIEWEAFQEASAQDDEESLRCRVAAHFSLMESASKALGTGLQIGCGIGRVTSLPKQYVEALALTPEVELLLDGPAAKRLEWLGARRMEAYWGADDQFLLSAVLLWVE